MPRPFLSKHGQTAVTRTLGLALSLGLGLGLPPAPALAQSMNHGHGHGHGADGTGHDEYTMPGLRGRDATPEESAEIAILFRFHRSLTRQVEHLPNGIRTETSSEHPEVRDILISHVVGMADRVAERRDPEIIIQSPTLDIILQRGDTIDTSIEVTDTGVIITQTSADPEVVKNLQTHADEVTDMVNRGMQSVHERMMRQSGQ